MYIYIYIYIYNYSLHPSNLFYSTANCILLLQIPTMIFKLLKCVVKWKKKKNIAASAATASVGGDGAVHAANDVTEL